ncbi:MAG: NUDIX domain-containing protein [Candidatus Diapherotrites archaeon]|uniref:NUDIX domain-containing protein n=1 Tax=Candidatus Iainarchaeum sp. TaxID=3101447 RepID=A0A8T4L7V3_9ARCH|nr:NUDIX domain-containing protein [Candidatus Diapherotrites archaeon]
MVLKRFGVLAIIYRLDSVSGEPLFLIMHRKLNWSGWELLKGGIEPNESEENALRREIFEESGLKKIEIIKHLDTNMVYWDRNRKIQNELSVFLVKTDEEESVSFSNNIVKEHDGFEWLSGSEAIRKLKFSDTKRLISFAQDELKKTLG